MRHLLFTLLTLAGLSGTAMADFECIGESLLPEVEREHPDIWTAALAEFEDVPNGTGLLWRIEKDGVPPSWLFGTIHVYDPATEHIHEAAYEILAEVDQLVLEVVEFTDPATKQESAARLLAESRLPDGQTIDEGFSDEQKEKLSALTARHGMPYFAARRLRPGFLGVALAIPACVKVAAARGKTGIDEALHARAIASDKPVAGLETVDEQIAIFNSFNDVFDAEMLLDLAESDVEIIESVFATLADAYARETVSIYELVLERLPEFSEDMAAFDAVMFHLIDERNLRMHERLLPILDEGSAMVAVGALHLPGDTGLVALLRQSGYTVTRQEVR